MSKSFTDVCITSDERNTAARALEIAIEQYTKDMDGIRSSVTSNSVLRRLMDQFQRQIDDAKNLLERIEE
jgi:hypothetical protein